MLNSIARSVAATASRAPSKRCPARIILHAPRFFFAPATLPAAFRTASLEEASERWIDCPSLSGRSKAPKQNGDDNAVQQPSASVMDVEAIAKRCLDEDEEPAVEKALPSGEDEQTHHAVVSTFDLFSIGVGPSSSHTVGPMRAARIFVNDLLDHQLLGEVDRLIVNLYGSLALTGIGHGTIDAVLLGMEGEKPELVDTESIIPRVRGISESRLLTLNGTHPVGFDIKKDIKLHPEPLPQHPNGMRFSAYSKKDGSLLATNEYFSVGGGFVISKATQVAHGDNAFYKADDKGVPDSRKSQDVVMTTAALPFTTCDDLMRLCKEKDVSIAEIVYQNELQWRTKEVLHQQLMGIWAVMDASIRKGITTTHTHLPGPLKVARRAPAFYRKLQASLWTLAAGVPRGSPPIDRPPIASPLPPLEALSPVSPQATGRQRKRLLLPALDCLSVYAIAVNEENASGGRVVTAPTNGAAGIIPAVLKYYIEFISEAPQEDIVEFLLTAAAIGMLFRRGNSLSAAEGGCQNEVGVACSMAAAGFAAVMGGTVAQVERAAEIGMEHNLGLTCDPVAGLVQIPCIERNAIGAVKAVCAAQLALNGDGRGRVTLDQVIKTAKDTGKAMAKEFRETSLGGLAVNVPLC